ncbi:hypothetical protein NKI12_28610 [Mesorhizobium australicum]|uniref:Uncharacterized protein n=1 Tax=Mesorhizobium australicum TaxID=536018 RepID=A0ACC6T7D8_9HYPH
MNAHVRTLKPYAMPKGMDPRKWRQEVGKRINELLDQSMALITALDLMEADCDMEETADDEPSLGWTDRGPQATSNMFLDGRGSAYDDREGDTSDWEDGADDEHSLGWREDASLSGNLGCHGSEDDLEPSLGSTEHVDQRRSMVTTENDWHVLDGEQDAGEMAEQPDHY